MAKVDLNLKKLTIPGKIALARKIVTAMTGNPNFPAPNPPLADITAAANGLEASYNAALCQLGGGPLPKKPPRPYGSGG